MKLSSTNKFSQNLKDCEDGSNSTPPFDIYLPYMFYKALDIVKIGVGCYCFIHAKAMREAVLQDKTNIVPTPFLFMAYHREQGRHST